MHVRLDQASIGRYALLRICHEADGGAVEEGPRDEARDIRSCGGVDMVVKRTHVFLGLVDAGRDLRLGKQ